MHISRGSGAIYEKNSKTKRNFSLSICGDFVDKFSQRRLNIVVVAEPEIFKKTFIKIVENLLENLFVLPLPSLSH